MNGYMNGRIWSIGGMLLLTFKDEGQTALFKDPVRTAQ
jgi:hypothetical protein